MKNNKEDELIRKMLQDTSTFFTKNREGEYIPTKVTKEEFEGRIIIYDYDESIFERNDYPKRRMIYRTKKPKRNKPAFKLRRYLNKKRRHAFMGSAFPNLMIYAQKYL